MHIELLELIFEWLFDLRDESPSTAIDEAIRQMGELLASFDDVQ